MKNRSRWISIVLILLLGCAAATVAATVQAEEKKVTLKKVLKVEDLTDEELQKLPASQTIEYKGRRMTVGEYRKMGEYSGYKETTKGDKTIRARDQKSLGQGQPKTIGAKRDVIRTEGLDEQKFEALPDSQVIEYEGGKITAGEIRRMRVEREEKERRVEVENLQARQKAEAELKALQQKNAREWKAELEAENAKVRAELARQRRLESDPSVEDRIEAIRKEALELSNKAKNASAAEKAKLDKRAVELLYELKALGVQVQ